MSCRGCEESIFKQKIGRCKSCMIQLTVLSLISWPLWWFGFAQTPTRIESIALLFFCCAFSGLLALHLVVLSYRRIVLGDTKMYQKTDTD
ncbi:DUF3624 domain-containing protein [Shewanella intestini]|uniref:DUF3624 family protein n=1 Tax=Shewanella intestini TaxID=2017544 RepID=A0ABS5HYZ6_9GAMM|nr:MULTISPECIES: DUF3624 domain-containing protein [Shewanella]MBR9727020.1 DUF3624 family protein [Shewanella intestini]MRG35821.1 DUF3624 family protein [Shewanella sp. XMDDZSB0408]